MRARKHTQNERDRAKKHIIGRWWLQNTLRKKEIRLEGALSKSVKNEDFLMTGLELRIIFLKWTFFWFFFGLSIPDFFFFVGSLSRLRNLLSPLCWSLAGLFFCSNLVGSLIVGSLARLRTLLGLFFMESY